MHTSTLRRAKVLLHSKTCLLQQSAHSMLLVLSERLWFALLARRTIHLKCVRSGKECSFPGVSSNWEGAAVLRREWRTGLQLHLEGSPNTAWGQPRGSRCITDC